jgi:hypothetical protein
VGAAVNTSEAFNLILLLIIVLAFYRTVNSEKNKLEFWHALSTRSADGVIYFDNDKIGQMTGLLFSTWIVCWLAYTDHLTIYYFGAWLLYASGMGAFSKWARAMITSRYGAKDKEPDKARDPSGTISATSTPTGSTMKITP